MRTKNLFVCSAILASAAVLGLAPAALAQSDPPANASQAKQHKLAPKKEKVWTNDDLPSAPAPAAARVDSPATSDAAQSTAAAGENSGSKQARGSGTPPVFTNPKSVADADRMIAWENRDIQAQQEFLLKVQKEIDEAPADQKDRLTKLLQQRLQILADTQNELKNVELKKKELEKPPADNSSASSEQPPQ